MDPFTYQLLTLYFVYLFLSHVRVAGINFGSILVISIDKFEFEFISNNSKNSKKKNNWMN